MKRTNSVYDLTLRDLDRIARRLRLEMPDSDLRAKIFRQLAEINLDIVIAKGKEKDDSCLSITTLEI